MEQLAAEAETPNPQQARGIPASALTLGVERLHYEPPTLVFRVMFNDGETRDVTAHRDDSRMREWLLEQHYGAKTPEGGGIAGIVQMDEAVLR